MKKLLALALIVSSLILVGCGESTDAGTDGAVVNTDTGAGKATANAETGDRG